MHYKRAKTIIIKSPSDNDGQKRFLGYDWSTRKGSEGIKYITKQSTNVDENDDKTIDNIKKLSDIDTMLYNPKNLDDEKKINSIIKKHFNNELCSIDKSLKEFANLVNLKDLINFDKANFDMAINLSVKNKIILGGKLKAIGDIAFIETGSRPKGGVGLIDSGVLSLGGEHINNTNGTINLNNPKFVTEQFYNNSTRGKLKENDILLCKDGALTGKIAFLKDELNGKKL